MDYLYRAFGDFKPQLDQDAAVKFVISIILMDERFDDLGCLLTDGHEIGGIGGDPGWIIERRDTGPSGDKPGYANWPDDARFHVHVDAKGYELAYPDMFMKENEFYEYVKKGLQAYIIANPLRTSEVTPLVLRLSCC